MKHSMQKTPGKCHSASKKTLCCSAMRTWDNQREKYRRSNLTFSFFCTWNVSFLLPHPRAQCVGSILHASTIETSKQEGVWIHLRIVAGKCGEWRYQIVVCSLHFREAVKRDDQIDKAERYLWIFHNSWQRTYPGYLEFYVHSMEYPAPTNSQMIVFFFPCFFCTWDTPKFKQVLCSLSREGHGKNHNC